MAPFTVIAAEAGCSVTTVQRALKRHGIPLRGLPGRGWDKVFTLDYLRREYVDKGRSAVEIAQEHGCHPSTVSYWLERHHLANGYPPRVMADENSIAEVVRLYESGRSLAYIAKRTGRSPQTIRRRLLFAGVQLRPPGRPFRPQG